MPFYLLKKKRIKKHKKTAKGKTFRSLFYFSSLFSDRCLLPHWKECGEPKAYSLIITNVMGPPTITAKAVAHSTFQCHALIAIIDTRLNIIKLGIYDIKNLSAAGGVGFLLKIKRQLKKNAIVSEPK